jgi:malic enzyme
LRKAIVALSLHADFEEEHGVGVLTDGEAILGLGYSADVLPSPIPFVR